MKLYNKNKAYDESVNITSLIDVVFMLVIFFMIGSSCALTSIPVTLPESSSAVETQNESLIVTIDSEGAVYINDEPVTTDDIRARGASLCRTARTETRFCSPCGVRREREAWSNQRGNRRA